MNHSPSPTPLIVAIDGPAGSGKSTIARRVAADAGLTFVDSGAIYRTVTRWSLDEGVAPEDEERFIALFAARRIRLSDEEGVFRVYFDGRAVGEEIRSPEVSRHVARYASQAVVREGVNHLLRDFGRRRGLVMDGRDIGSVVFPRAGLKIFLTATAEERARRRHAEFLARGETMDFFAVLADVQERDRLDETRSLAPLVAAPDAIRLDTTGRSIDEVTEEVLRRVRERLP